MKNKKIILAGGTGFMGQEMTKYFGKENKIIILTRQVNEKTNRNDYNSLSVEDLPCTSSSFPDLRKSYAIADAIKMDEYAPKPIPINNANINPLRLSPPKMKIARITSKVVNVVLNVLPKVLEIASSNNPDKVSAFFSLKYSLILSKIITVSLIE